MVPHPNIKKVKKGNFNNHWPFIQSLPSCCPLQTSVFYRNSLAPNPPCFPFPWDSKWNHFWLWSTVHLSRLKTILYIIGRQVTQLSSIFHPQTNGQCERLNQEIENSLRYLSSQYPITWSRHLSWIEYFHNAHISSATGLSPFKVPLGYQPLLLPASFPDPVIPSVCAQTHLESDSLSPSKNLRPK